MVIVPGPVSAFIEATPASPVLLDMRMTRHFALATYVAAAL
jgi:hypothetical protein